MHTDFTREKQHSGQERGLGRRVIIAIAVVALLITWGIASRLVARADLHRVTEEQAIPTVAVTKSTPSPSSEKLVLPGDVQAFIAAPIYARTNGYLKRWQVDIGARVKEGQLLAEIDTPEVDQQLDQAQADLHTAEANENLSRTTAERWKELLKTDSVSKQDADEKIGDYASKQAITASARANLRRLHELQGFQRIVAPFDGTITTRNIDIGQLVTAASGRELFHIADLSKLRVYVQVPQPYAPEVHVGLAAALNFPDHPGKEYPAKIIHTADALDPAVRTLLVELEVDNSKGELFPGAYSEVHFDIPGARGSVRIPANALIYRGDGLSVAVPGADSKVTLKQVVLGRDFGTTIEVLSGLGPNEQIIINPPDSLAEGEKVRIVPVQGEAQAEPQSTSSVESPSKASR